MNPGEQKLDKNILNMKTFEFRICFVFRISSFEFTNYRFYLQLLLRDHLFRLQSRMGVVIYGLLG